ncbi:MAG: chromosomal replication initiator protein DnaA [Pseudomonadota bacterium]
MLKPEPVDVAKFGPAITGAASADEPAQHWDRIRARLRQEIGEDVYSSWFARLELDKVSGDTVHLSVPTRFLKSWIQGHYVERLAELWRDETGAPRKVDVAVRSAAIRSQPLKAREPRATVVEQPVEPRRASQPAVAAPAPAAAPAAPPTSDVAAGSPLDPRLTFETFVLGKSNTLAHAAARQVADAAAGAAPIFNPLYLHAPVGLGKTHLLQAAAWAGAARGRRVVYLTAERFMYGFVAALKSHAAIAFKDALRSIDTLLIDDLQFLTGKNMQQEFCHTLNALIDAGRQVMVAADRPPSELDGLDDRVRSRLAGGLVVELGTLEEELRLQILKARSQALAEQHRGFQVPAPVLELLARNVGQSGRDLDGALNKLLACNRLTGEPVTLEMAETAIRDLVRPSDPKRVRVEDILRVVAKHYNVSRADLLSQRRTANVVKPRQIAMYLAKTLTLRSLPEIGRRFGGRDHTTVLHAVRKIDGLIASDRALADEIEALKRLVNE